MTTKISDAEALANELEEAAKSLGWIGLPEYAMLACCSSTELLRQQDRIAGLEASTDFNAGVHEGRAQMQGRTDGLERQASAYKMLQKSMDVRMAAQSERLEKAKEATSTLQSERDANAILTERIAELEAQIEAMRAAAQALVLDPKSHIKKLRLEVLAWSSPAPKPAQFLQQSAEDAVAAERERICAAIKAEDDHCATGDYMLDSDDCIKVVRGTWERPIYDAAIAVQADKGGAT